MHFQKYKIMSETYIKTELTIEDIVNCSYALKHEIEKYKEKKEKSLLHISFSYFDKFDERLMQSYRNTLARLLKYQRKIQGRGKYEQVYK